jgi:hypothetical protein
VWWWLLFRSFYVLLCRLLVRGEPYKFAFHGCVDIFLFLMKKQIMRVFKKLQFNPSFRVQKFHTLSLKCLA